MRTIKININTLDQQQQTASGIAAQKITSAHDIKWKKNNDIQVENVGLFLTILRLGKESVKIITNTTKRTLETNEIQLTETRVAPNSKIIIEEDTPSLLLITVNKNNFCHSCKLTFNCKRQLKQHQKTAEHHNKRKEQMLNKTKPLTHIIMERQCEIKPGEEYQLSLSALKTTTLQDISYPNSIEAAIIQHNYEQVETQNMTKIIVNQRIIENTKVKLNIKIKPHGREFYSGHLHLLFTFLEGKQEYDFVNITTRSHKICQHIQTLKFDTTKEEWRTTTTVPREPNKLNHQNWYEKQTENKQQTEIINLIEKGKQPKPGKQKIIYDNIMRVLNRETTMENYEEKLLLHQQLEREALNKHFYLKNITLTLVNRELATIKMSETQAKFIDIKEGDIAIIQDTNNVMENTLIKIEEIDEYTRIRLFTQKQYPTKINIRKLQTTFNFDVITSLCSNGKINKTKKLLFPNNHTCEPKKSIHFQNLTEEQRVATEKILGMDPSAPFLLSGSPGTGKTTIILETILNLIKTNRILVSTPTNSSADNIARKAEKLLKLHNINQTVRRITSPSHLTEEQCKSTCFVKNNTHYFPSMQEIKEVNLLITTTITAARLGQTKEGPWEPNMIIIDEAAFPGENMIIPTIAPFNTTKSPKLVLVGDSRQLIYTPRSVITASTGFLADIMGRLRNSEPYKSEKSNRHDIVMNFRNPKQIVKILNTISYENEIKSNKENSQNKIRAIHVESIIETIGYSKYSYGEALSTIQIIKKINQQDPNATPVVICYYKGQQNILSTLAKRNRLKCQVQTSENIQGQESTYIILNPCVSHDTWLNPTGSWTKSKRRAVVSLSRCQGTFFIVGNLVAISKIQPLREIVKQAMRDDEVHAASLRVIGKLEATFKQQG